MPTLEQIRLQLEHSLADLRMMEIAQRPADKWEKEKAAFARGETIQFRFVSSEWQDNTPDNPPIWDKWLGEYRIKPAPVWTPKFKVGDRVKWSVPNSSAKIVTIMHQPRGGVWQVKLSEATVAFANEIDLELAPWTLSRHLPGFRELADGEEWSDADSWQEGMLQPNERPLLARELLKAGDKFRYKCYVTGEAWSTECADCAANYGGPMFLRKTSRPLPALPTERVALEAKDVPPGSFIRTKEQNSWQAIVAVDKWGLYTVNRNRTTSISVLLWRDLLNWQILRPGQTAWQPCSKESRAE